MNNDVVGNNFFFIRHNYRSGGERIHVMLLLSLFVYFCWLLLELNFICLTCHFVIKIFDKYVSVYDITKKRIGECVGRFVFIFFVSCSKNAYFYIQFKTLWLTLYPTRFRLKLSFTYCSALLFNNSRCILNCECSVEKMC